MTSKKKLTGWWQGLTNQPYMVFSNSNTLSIMQTKYLLFYMSFHASGHIEVLNIEKALYFTNSYSHIHLTYFLY